MSWVKLDDHANEHEKQVDAGPEACWLWACGLMYCNRQKKRTGFIPETQLPGLYVRFTPKKAKDLAKELVRVRLWEKVDGGYLVHDYDQYQPSSGGGGGGSDLSSKRAEAGRAGGLRSGESRRSKPEANAKQLLEAIDEATPSRAGVDARRAGTGSGYFPTGSSSPEQEEPTGKRALDADDTSPEAERAAEYPPAPDDLLALAEGCFQEAFRKRYRREFIPNADTGRNGDEPVLLRLAKLARDRGAPGAKAWLDHWFRSYLADNDPWLAREIHPLRALEKRLNRYEPKGNRLVPDGPRLVRTTGADEPPALPSKERLEELRAMARGVSKGFGP